MYNQYVSRTPPQRLEEPEHRRDAPAEPFPGGVLESLRSLLRGLKKGEGKLFSGIPVLEKLDSGDLLLILVLLLFAANVGVVVWYLLRYRGLLP